MSTGLDKLAEQIAAVGKEQKPDNKVAVNELSNIESISEDTVSDEQTEVSQEREFSEIEKKALDMGWKPAGEYPGENFVDAQEYVNRAPLFKRIDQQKKEIQELRDVVKRTTDHLSQTSKLAYERALKDLEVQRDKAVEEGDKQAFRTTEARVNDLRTQMQNDPIIQQSTQQQSTQPIPEALEFAKRNEWFNQNTPENVDMVEAAHLIDNQLARQALREGRQLNPAEHFAAIEREIKRIFPNRFKSEAPVAPTVGRSTVSRERGTVISNLVAKLTPQQMELGKYLEKNSFDPKTKKSRYTLEMYAKDIHDQQAGK